MPMLIDGYNLYHAAVRVDEEWQALSRSAMCRYVESFLGPRSDALIVFDGAWPRERCEEESMTGPVQVTYAGPGRDADTVIERLIEANTAPRRLIVVSSDRRLRTAAKRRGCRSVRAEEFAVAIYLHWRNPPKPRPSEPPEKRRGLNDPDLAEAWMAELGLTEDDLPPDEFPWR